MRNLARIGATLGVMAVVATATAGVASAAPPGFKVDVNHSTGALATSTWGDLSWSSSLRTVTIANRGVFMRAGECYSLSITGFQGATKVTEAFTDSDCATEGVNETWNWPFSLSLTATVPGGIDHVIIRLTDTGHDIKHYNNCYQSASVCQKNY